jgi:hypothetical protein
VLTLSYSFSLRLPPPFRPSTRLQLLRLHVCSVAPGGCVSFLFSLFGTSSASSNSRGCAAAAAAAAGENGGTASPSLHALAPLFRHSSKGLERNVPARASSLPPLRSLLPRGESNVSRTLPSRRWNDEGGAVSPPRDAGTKRSSLFLFFFFALEFQAQAALPFFFHQALPAPFRFSFPRSSPTPSLPRTGVSPTRHRRISAQKSLERRGRGGASSAG